jgi:hypothetical protein
MVIPGPRRVVAFSHAAAVMFSLRSFLHALALTVMAAAATILPQGALAEVLVAKVNLKFIEDTGITASYMCLDDAGKECVAWATFYLYEARVREVIAGTETRSKFLVLYGAHALGQKSIRGVVAAMEPRPSDRKPHADYQVLQMTDAQKMYCFDSAVVERAPIAAHLEGVEQLSCFTEE